MAQSPATSSVPPSAPTATATLPLPPPSSITGVAIEVKDDKPVKVSTEADPMALVYVVLPIIGALIAVVLGYQLGKHQLRKQHEQNTELLDKELTSSRRLAVDTWQLSERRAVYAGLIHAHRQLNNSFAALAKDQAATPPANQRTEHELRVRKLETIVEERLDDFRKAHSDALTIGDRELVVITNEVRKRWEDLSSKRPLPDWSSDELTRSTTDLVRLIAKSREDLGLESIEDLESLTTTSMIVKQPVNYSGGGGGKYLR